MIKFAGFDDWIPIFRGGKQIDSNGVEHDGSELIDKALAKFNTAKHEPSICIGHPKEDAPAYGWVTELKEGADKLGRLLLAKFGQVEPTFGAMVKDGRFKKRSAAFYPDGTLRHVAFLGAMPPAVKGLPNMAFAEGDAASFEFSDTWAWSSLADIFRNLREYLIVKEGPDTADQIVPDYKIEDLRSAANPPADVTSLSGDEMQPNLYKEKEDTNMTLKDKAAALFAEIFAKSDGETPVVIPQAAAAGQFSEADIEKARTDAEKKGREAATAEFAEKQKQTWLTTLKGEIAAFCESLIKEGKITPATVAFGLPEILFSLAESDNQIEFGETKEKFTAFDRMKALLESATPLITFAEVATRDKDAGGAGTAGAKLEKLTQAKMKELKDLTYTAAFAEVQKENPELTQEYSQELSGA